MGPPPGESCRGASRCRRSDRAPKWALTTGQAASLLTVLPPLARTMVGLAILSGLRRGELFALRWKDITEHARLLTVREAVYDGKFDTPQTEAGSRQIPLSGRALQLMVEWKATLRTRSRMLWCSARVWYTHFAE